ncbi:MAG: NADH-quinone oxidoreductase subunit NuoG, partial [Solirubrobacterales bacterium]
MTRQIRNAVTLVVDGREVVAPEGTMLVDAAKGGDVEIPVFCYEPKLGEPVGACRMCLVEIEGMPKLQTACSTPVRDGMVVYTQTDQVQEAQNAVVEFLLINHPLDCPVCDKGGECPLQDISMGWGPGKNRFTDPKRHFQKPLQLSPLVAIDRERCILCYRCVRFSQEVAEDEQLQLLERGDRSFVGTFEDRPYVAPFHGNITELCPVGALTSYTYRFRARPWDIEDAGTVCTLCPSQCNIKLTVRDEGVARVLARDNAEVDDGWLCDKGRYGFQMLRSEERITQPMARAGDGSLSPLRWEQALERIAKGLRETDAGVAALVEGGASNEEGWLLQKIVRGALGSPHVASSPAPVDADLLRELSRPELSARTSEIDIAGAILVVGCDPLNESPILDLRIRKAVRREGARLAVASERPTALDGGAEHSARYAPGEAAAFLGALAAELGAPGYERSDAFADQVEELAKALAGVPDPVIVWGERLWRSPGAVEALLACARALGIDKRVGPGLLEVPAAANGRGLREVGCHPGAGPGLTTTTTAGIDANGIRTALESDELDALILFDSDPVRTHHESSGWEHAMKKAGFVVAVSMFDNASAKLANIVLPLEGYGEKDGTVTHPDGRIQRLRRTVDVPDGVRLGWHWLLELSAALGQDLGI